MIIRIFAAVLLVLIFPTSFAQALSAETKAFYPDSSSFFDETENHEAKTRYSNINSVNTSIAYNGSTATCAVDVVGVSGTTKISITMSLQRLGSNGSYTTVKTWSTETVNSDMFYLSKTYVVLSGESYRTHAEIKVTRNGVTETVQKLSKTLRCP